MMKARYHFSDIASWQRYVRHDQRNCKIDIYFAGSGIAV
ncbi:hypothetical protein SC1_03148 [Sphingopyxis sp. C-1]|nr:hypothetical protein SC1_03148 [Sphingopyxis sp. C-1]